MEQATHPEFSAVPNNISKWAQIATHIITRYVEGMKYAIRDWGVWNEPGGGYEDGHAPLT